MKLDSINNMNPTAPVTERPQLHLPGQAAAGAVAAAAATQVIDQSQIRKALEEINRTMKSMAGSLEFSVDQQTRKTVVRIIDTSTNQLIRQIPSEEMLAIAKSLDKLQGLLIKQRA